MASASQSIKRESRPSTAVESQEAMPNEKPRIVLTDQTNLLPFRKVIVVFLSLALCISVSSLDNVVIATAISTISTALNAGSVISWVPAAFLLTSTVFQPLYGRFSDIFGRKAALSISMVIYIIGNLISGFSKSVNQLIIARAISGAGEGGIISTCQIIISDIVSLRDRGKYQGILAVFAVLGYGVGPLIGGVLSEKVTWRWCFWITLPIAAIATTIVLVVLPLKPVQGGMKRKLLIIDYPGAFLSLVCFTLALLPLIWGGVTFPWKSPEVLATLIAGLFIGTIFCLWEWKGARLPMVPMHIFQHSTVVGVYIGMFVNGFVFYSSVYYIPQYLQVVFGYSPLKSGLFLTALMGGLITTSWVSGLLVSRTGTYRTILYSGFAWWSVACGLIATITPSTRKAVIIVYVLLSGFGGGQTFQTSTVAAQASVARQDMAVVTAFRNFIRLFGGALSQAISATIINNTLRSSMHSLELQPSLISAIIDKPIALASPASLGLSQEQASFILSHGYGRGFRTLFILNASWTAFATISTIFLVKHKDLSRPGDTDNKGAENVDELSKADAPPNTV